MNKTILYIGNFSFPFGNAAGKRVYSNGKALRALGYEVVFIGTDKGLAVSKTIEETKKMYDGFSYYNFMYPKGKLEWLDYNKKMSSLVNFINDTGLKNNISMVIYYGSPTISIFNTKLITFCKKNEIKVISDCVDWISVKTDNLLFDIVKLMDTTYQKAYANKKADGIITISSFLEKYYKKSGCKTVIIPPLSFKICEEIEKKIEHTNTKKIIYAGIPFRKGKKIKDCSKLKDRIDKTIILLCYAKRKKCNFIFDIYGFTKEEYLEVIPEQRKYIEELSKSIVFHGLKENDEVVQAIKKSDFSILIRDNNRTSNAGFPTKVSESISYGVPVITTKTSDLEEYIIEGESAFFLNDDSLVKMLSKLVEIINLDSDKLIMMKKSCIRGNVFYYGNYKEKLDNFLKILMK